MCAVSMIGDHYRDKWQDRYGQFGIWPQQNPNPFAPPQTQTVVIRQSEITREEFDKLREEVAEMKALLARAKEYDERTGQADCEMDEKMDLLRKVAKLVGVDLDDVLKPAAA